MYFGYYNTWAVSPTVDETRYFGAGAVSGSGALTLKTQVAGLNGVGYKVFFRSAGDSHLQTYTLVGHKMGTPYGTLTTETITGPTSTTAVSTGYYDSITSITASGAMTGNQSIGVGDGATGSLTSIALPHVRIIGVHWVGAASAGTIVVNRNATTGTELLRVNTPAGVTLSGYVFTGGIPTGGSAAISDFGLVTPTNVVFYTFILG